MVRGRTDAGKAGQNKSEVGFGRIEKRQESLFPSLDDVVHYGAGANMLFGHPDFVGNSTDGGVQKRRP